MLLFEVRNLGHITETTGDLYLISAESSNGNVSVTASNGSIFDNNLGGEEDLNARQEILDAVDAVLRLTEESGALDSISEAQAAFASSKEQEYERYWQYRNLTNNSDITYTDDNTDTVLNDFGKLIPENSSGVAFSSTDFTNYFSDAEGDSLATITITAIPTSGELQFNGETISTQTEIPTADLGNLVYIPETDFTGDVDFEVQADDGNGNTDNATITLRIGNSNNAPSLGDITGQSH